MSNEKIDMLYQVIVRIDWNVERLIAAVCLVLLCKDFMECVSSRRKKRGLALIGSVYFLIYMGLYWIQGFGGYFVNIIALTMAFLVCLWVDHRKIRTKLFLFCTFLVICWTIDFMSNTISYFFATQADKVIYYLAGPQNPSLQGYYFASFCGYILLDLVLNGISLFLIIYAIRKVFVNKGQDMELPEFFFLMIPVVNGMAAHSIFRLYRDAYEEKTGIPLYQEYPAEEYLWTFYYAILLASVISMIILYQKIRKKQEDENARLMLENQVKDMQSHIAEVERLYMDIRGVKHDIRNHMEIVNSLLTQGRTEEVHAYSKSLVEMVETLDFSIKTGNPVADVIIHEKWELAQKQGIEFISDFYYPSDMEINVFDVSIIISNALSNALEATKEGGFIKISSFRNKNAYLITVENSFDGKLDMDGMDGLPKTGKEDKTVHGFGLQNIKSVAAKYHGDVQIERCEKNVILTVMLLAFV